MVVRPHEYALQYALQQPSVDAGEHRRPRLGKKPWKKFIIALTHRM